jgi:trehalose 6-phosphate synthase/phosphatase
MAGAASELGEALIVNANNKAQIIHAIKEAMEMPPEEQIERNRMMQARLKRYTVSRWANDFLDSLRAIRKEQQAFTIRRLTAQAKHELKQQAHTSRRRLFILDYDGTLVSHRLKPGRAGPDAELLNLLRQLVDRREDDVVLVSGRTRDVLDQWFADLHIGLVGEHGAWLRHADEGQWKCLQPMEAGWKATLKPIMEMYADRTPGAIVQEKDYSLVWNCRRSERELAHTRMQELRDHIMNMISNLDVGVFEGPRVLEVRHLGVNKGRALESWFHKTEWDFILTAGDDYTDEEVFEVVPEGAYSLKVGAGMSKARFYVENIRELRTLLKDLTGHSNAAT